MSEISALLLHHLHGLPDGRISTMHLELPECYKSRLGNVLTFKLYYEEGAGVVAEYEHQTQCSGILAQLESEKFTLVEPRVYRFIHLKLRENGLELRGLVAENSKRRMGRLLDPTAIGRSP